MKKIIFYILASFVFITNAQKKTSFNQEAFLNVDNDAFLIEFRDGYYTGGFFAGYRWLSDAKNKKIKHFLLGQQMYTPASKTFAHNNIVDRPYAGYLFLQYGISNFKKKNTFFSWQGNLGVVGPASQAGQFQEAYHRWVGFKFFPGWEKQIKNTITFDIAASYAIDLKQLSNEKTDWKSIIPFGEVQLGTTYTGAAAGAFFCLGRINQINESALFNSRIGNSKPLQKELFIYFKPSVRLQAFNATIQGGLYSNNFGAVTGQPNDFIYQSAFGISYTLRRFSWNVELNRLTREAKGQTFPHRYIALRGAYRF